MSTALNFSPRYTVDDYALWRGDWELWEGIAIAMSPSPFGIHQAIVSRLNRLLGVAIESANCNAEALVELDWIIHRDTVVRPDVVIVCGPTPERHLEQTPALVAEVLSNSTRSNDLNYKRQLYQRESVGLYLIIDSDAKTVEVDCRQADGVYRTFQSGAELTLRVFEDCELTIPTNKLFYR